MCEARTGYIDGQKKHAHRAVDMKRTTQVTKHGHAGPEQAEMQKCSSVRPLFRVGSLVSARISHRNMGRQPSRGSPMGVKQVLGRYKFVLSDGERWSARRLV